jgi:inosine-uridine nucleoside N-ribohydrolase
MRKIIIDTDPGQDDAIAILTALASPEELDVIGITTVGGNVPLELTTKNALMMVELANRSEVPVVAGHLGPKGRRLVTAEYVQIDLTRLLARHLASVRSSSSNNSRRMTPSRSARLGR